MVLIRHSPYDCENDQKFRKDKIQEKKSEMREPLSLDMRGGMTTDKYVIKLLRKIACCLCPQGLKGIELI